jgi:hypothetical protein
MSVSSDDFPKIASGLLTNVKDLMNWGFDTGNTTPEKLRLTVAAWQGPPELRPRRRTRRAPAPFSSRQTFRLPHRWNRRHQAGRGSHLGARFAPFRDLAHQMEKQQ